MPTTINVINTSGAQVEALELNECWLEREKGVQAVHDAVVAFLAAQRSGSACTKTRGDVQGTGAKPYRQKGTGRARAGSRKSPVWRGGGIVFGPKPRSYDKQVNRKVLNLALRRAFTERLDAGEVIVVDSFDVAAPKTKEVVALLDAIKAGDDALVLVKDLSPNLEMAARNLPGVEVMKASAVNTYFMLLFKKVVITRDGLEELGARIAGKEVAE
jgi:large subunit ribosomal protein L4